jgi:hypothetical protein
MTRTSRPAGPIRASSSPSVTPPRAAVAHLLGQRDEAGQQLAHEVRPFRHHGRSRAHVRNQPRGRLHHRHRNSNRHASGQGHTRASETQASTSERARAWAVVGRRACWASRTGTRTRTPPPPLGTVATHALKHARHGRLYLSCTWSSATNTRSGSSSQRNGCSASAARRAGSGGRRRCTSVSGTPADGMGWRVARGVKRSLRTLPGPATERRRVLPRAGGREVERGACGSGRGRRGGRTVRGGWLTRMGRACLLCVLCERARRGAGCHPPGTQGAASAVSSSTECSASLAAAMRTCESGRSSAGSEWVAVGPSRRV